MSFVPIVGQKVLVSEIIYSPTVISPEAIGVVEKVRGDGSLQVIEVRILPGQPGALLRIAGVGQWQLFSNADGGES
jgi:hypothetical protein